jgi:predicted DNA-binding WGR domain protein
MSTRAIGGAGTNQYARRGHPKEDGVPQPQAAGMPDLVQQASPPKPKAPTATAVGWRLTKVEGRSNKYYLIVVFGNVLTFLWGRNGTAGQAQLVVPGHPRDIANLAEEQTRKKMGRGYRPESSPRQFEIDQGMAARLHLAAKQMVADRYGPPVKQKIDHSWVQAVVDSYEEAAHDPTARLDAGDRYRSNRYWEAAQTGQEFEIEIPRYIQAMWELAH